MDIEKFLLPISEDFPAGSSVAYTPLYEHIREGRKGEEVLEETPDGVWMEVAPRRDWRKIYESCETLLCGQSKDLQVAAWLCEALFFLKGLGGFEEGLTLFYGLSERFWSEAFPELGEENSGRLAPYEWLEYHMPKAMLSLEIVSSAASKLTKPYTWADWVDALHWENARHQGGEIVSSAMASHKPLVSDILKAVQETPVEFYQTLSTQGSHAIDVLCQLESLLSQRFQEHIPQFLHLKKEMGLFAEHLHTWQSHAFVSTLSQTTRTPSPSPAPSPFNTQTEALSPPEEEETDPFAPEPLTDSLSASFLPPPQPPYDMDALERSGPSPLSFSHLGHLPLSLNCREDAYACLGHVAQFLAIHDPHSPTPYLLQRALTWQHKTLPDIYEECSHDPEVFGLLMRFLNIRP